MKSKHTLQAEQLQYLDELLEDVAIVRRHFDPVGDMPIVTLLHDLREARLERTIRRSTPVGSAVALPAAEPIPSMEVVA